MTETNYVKLMGIIHSEPKQRECKNGSLMINLTLRTDERYNNKNYSEYHLINLFGEIAKANIMLEKGDYIEVEGKLQHRRYMKDDIEKNVTSVKVSNLRIVEKSVSHKQQSLDVNIPKDDDDIPF